MSELGFLGFKDYKIKIAAMIVRGILTEVDGAFILYPQVFAEDVVPNE